MQPLEDGPAGAERGGAIQGLRGNARGTERLGHGIGEGHRWGKEEGFAVRLENNILVKNGGNVDLMEHVPIEADEIEADLARGNRAGAAAEIGDLLFAVVNLGRHLDADPEATLRATNQKFERRFAAIEQALAARGKTPQQATLTEMDALWDEAKAAESSSSEPG